MKRTIMKYGKYTITLEQGMIDRKELAIVLMVSATAVMILVGKYIGLEVISSWITLR